MDRRHKSCFVPYCLNTSIKTPNKKFVTVPINEERRRRWFEAVRRTSFGKNTTYHCCEDHFDFQNDMENYLKYTMIGGNIILKRNVEPHIFDWPEQSTSKRRRVETTFFESIPSTSKASDEVLPTMCSVGTQYSSNVTEQYQQTEISVNDVSVSCNIKLQQKTVKLDTSSLCFNKDVETSPRKKKRLHIEESSTEKTSDVLPSSSDFVPKSDGSENGKANIDVPCILQFIDKYPKRYIGVPKIWYPTLVNTLCKHSKIKKEYILLCLMKIKLNDSYARLGDQFSLSMGGASHIFRNNVFKIHFFLKKFIFWPEQDIIKKNLPIPFRARYSEVQSIIDCLEIQIQKPSNPVNQALTWSQYKKCNTLKYLVSCTPNGFINFISTGFGGRISDTLLMEKSEYLNVLPPNSVVMADRGFKEVEQLLWSRKKCTLLRPPSVSSSVKPTREEVLETKRIASLRIHIERLIRRLREFAYLKPHSVIDHSLIFYTDVIIHIACSLSNLQSPLIK